jgi:hypothetical protein
MIWEQAVEAVEMWLQEFLLHLSALPEIVHGVGKPPIPSANILLNLTPFIFIERIRR